jgi:hypothetical protein
MKTGAIKGLALTVLCLLLAGTQMARAGVNEDSSHAAKAAPTKPSQPGVAMDAYYSWMQTNLDALEKNLPAITTSADAAAEKYVTGEWDLCASGDSGVVGEAVGRSGGVMSFRWGSPIRQYIKPGTKQIVLLALREDHYEAYLKQAREKLADASSFVILMGPASLLERARKDGFLHAATIDNQAAPGEGLFPAAGGSRAVSTSPVANLAGLWTWTGEFVAACTRRGKMPVLYQSFGVPGAKDRAEKLKGVRFEEQVPAPIKPGVLGKAYLNAARSDLGTFYKAERENLEKASRLAFETARQGHKLYAFLHGHAIVMDQLTYPSSTGIFTQLNPNNWFAQNPKFTLAQGDFVLCVGYASRFHDGDFKGWDDSARKAGATLAWSFTDYQPAEVQAVRDAGELWINQHWAYGDAAVEIPGYDLKAFPTSGLIAMAVLRLVEAGVFGLNREIPPKAPGGCISLGDAGHFITQFMPEISLNNPSGRAFTVTVHRYVWPEASFNGGGKIVVRAPDGSIAGETKLLAGQSEGTISVPAGGKGVYRLEGGIGGYSLFWFETDLDQAVVKAPDIGTITEGSPGYQVVMLHAIVPRRWYFYVPPGTKSFEVQTVIGTYQTHREDFGLLVMNPRGQRVAALYGGLSPTKPRLKEASEIFPCTIEPDPGTTGRFWNLWLTGGDSHCYSDLRIVLKGVPPYMAPTPEQWFDPSTGAAPLRLVYDDSPIREPGKDIDPKTGRPQSTDFYRCTPTPFLGDEDFNGIRGAASVFLLNPENRPLDFGAGSYLPPSGGLPVSYTLFGPGGVRLDKKNATFLHKSDYRLRIPASGAGIYRVDVDSPAWYAWSDPAVPMVLAGHPDKDGGASFAIQTSIARHWFFRVPKGVASFSVAAKVADPDHALLLEVHTPDRLMDLACVRGGEPRSMTIRVPSGADGKTWFLRTEVGSPTRFVSPDGSPPRHTRIDADITLRGVPGYLAPTWEQWFDPTQAATAGASNP